MLWGAANSYCHLKERDPHRGGELLPLPPLQLVITKSLHFLFASQLPGAFEVAVTLAKWDGFHQDSVTPRCRTGSTVAKGQSAVAF